MNKKALLVRQMSTEFFQRISENLLQK